MHKKTLWSMAVMLGCLLAAAVMIVPAQAMLMVYSPDEMLQRADHIIVGTITSIDTNDNRQTARIDVDEELKGKADDVIRVEEGATMPLAGAPDVFPDEDSRVFLVLEEDGDHFRLVSGMNAVALMDDKHVTDLYHGYNVGINGKQWTISDYVEAYDDYYHNQDESSSQTDSHSSTIITNGSGIYVNIHGQGGRVTVRINGQEIDTDVSPVIIHDRTVVPLRRVAEEMGLKVEWNDEDGTVTLSGEDENGDPFEITLKIGSGQVSGRYSERIRKIADDILQETSPMIIDGHTMVPLRFLADIIAAPLEWDEHTGTVSITRSIHSSFNQNSFNNIYDYSHEEPTSVLNEDNDNDTVTLDVGETVELQLKSNISTGYTWVVHEQPDSDVVRFSGGSWLPQISGTSLLGSGGTQTWRVTGTDEGETTLELWYCRPWESRNPDSKFSLTIKVK